MSHDCFSDLGLGAVIFDYSGTSELYQTQLQSTNCSRDNQLILPFPCFLPCTEPLGGPEKRKPDLRADSQIPVDTPT